MAAPSPKVEDILTPTARGERQGRTALCRNGPTCKFGGKCNFFHPWEIPCRDGKKCVREDCHYGHKSKTPCKFGAKCTRRETCTFGHENGGELEITFGNLNVGDANPESP